MMPMTTRISMCSVESNEMIEIVSGGREKDDGEDGRLERVERARIAHRAIGRKKAMINAVFKRRLGACSSGFEIDKKAR